MGTSRRATILDVAAAAGVSRQTVTRAVNDMPGISEETKRRVLDAARELSYRPSRFGRGLVTGGTRQLGLVVDDLRNPYSPELAAAVVRRAAQEGWNVLLVDIGLSGDVDRLLSSLRDQVDVVVGYLGARSEGWGEGLGATPLIELDPARPSARAAVGLDPRAAIEQLAGHLVARGVRRPSVLDASASGAVSARGAALLDAFSRRGTPADLLRAPASTAEQGAEAALAAVRRPTPPDAIVAFNDLMALGVLSACRREGRDVPRDIRVAGIDGLAVGELVAPALTTLAVDFDELARHALDLAGALLRGEGAESRTVAHRLLLRESA